MIAVEQVRADLPAAARAAYLNAGTFGPMPRAAADAMRAHLVDVLEEGRIGTAAFAFWKEVTTAARQAFATALGAGEGEIALTRSTTEGVNTVVWGLDWRPGDEVVTTDAEHPGLTAPLAELARRRGVRIRVAVPTRVALAAELSERTRLVAVSHVLWTDGETLPLAGIAADAHAAGALLLVDGAQSGGAIPVDPGALGADFYTLSGQKWLLGPSGTGALWIRPERLASLATPWPWYLSENRRPGVAPEAWPDARRLDAGSMNLTALAGVAAAIRWRAEAVGFEPGHAHAAALADALRGLLAELPGVVPARVEHPSTLVAFHVAGQSPADVVTALEERGVLVRYVPGPDLVRASVGFWNDSGDLERLAAGVRAIA